MTFALYLVQFTDGTKSLFLLLKSKFEGFLFLFSSLSRNLTKKKQLGCFRTALSRRVTAMEATEWLLSCKLIRKLQIMYSLFDENIG